MVQIFKNLENQSCHTVIVVHKNILEHRDILRKLEFIGLEGRNILGVSKSGIVPLDVGRRHF